MDTPTCKNQIYNCIFAGIKKPFSQINHTMRSPLLLSISIILLLIITSCRHHHKFELIREYEQNGHQMDLQFEGINYVILDTIYYKDSLAILKPIFETNLQNALKYFHHEVQSSIRTVQWINNFHNNEIKHFKKILEEEQHYQEYLMETMKVFTDECCDGTYLKGPMSILEKYQLYPDSLIGYTVLVKYSALNADFDYNNRSVTTATYLLNFQDEVIIRKDEKSLLSQNFMAFPYD